MPEMYLRTSTLLVSLVLLLQAGCGREAEVPAPEPPSGWVSVMGQ